MKKHIALIKGPVTRVPTPREREIMQLVVEGMTNVEIAGQLKIHTKTVEAHRANLYRKLGVRNSAQLVQVAIASGFAKLKGIKAA